MIRSIPVLPALLLCGLSHAELPRNVEVTYDVSWNGMTIAKATDSFQHDGKQFSIHSDTKTVGLAAVVHKMNIRREVHGAITPAGLQSGTFVEERTKKPRKAASFDWNKKQVVLENGTTTQTVALSDTPAFDQSAFAWSFAFNSPSSKDYVVALTDGRKLSDYRFTAVGKEKLSTPVGEMETLHFKKIQEAGDKRGFEFWLATQKHFLPVRILFTDDGDTVDSTVSTLSFPAKPQK